MANIAGEDVMLLIREEAALRAQHLYDEAISKRSGTTMVSSKLETITREEFEKRLDSNNDRLRQELAEAQERVQRLELLVSRKESFAQHLTHVLTEIEREEDEITALEKGLRVSRGPDRRRRPLPHTAL
jgi:hypothetical protein